MTIAGLSNTFGCMITRAFMVAASVASTTLGQVDIDTAGRSECDLNGDGVVDRLDFDQFGAMTGEPRIDLNADGRVDSEDLFHFVRCATASIAPDSPLRRTIVRRSDGSRGAGYQVASSPSFVSLCEDDFSGGVAEFTVEIQTGWFGDGGFGPRSVKGTLTLPADVMLVEIETEMKHFRDGPSSGDDGFIDVYRANLLDPTQTNPPQPHGVDELITATTLRFRVTGDTARTFNIELPASSSNIIEWTYLPFTLSWWPTEFSEPQSTTTNITVQVQALGACCLLDGTCSDLCLEDCIAAGGTFHEGVSCFELPCAILGACCLPDNTCSELSEQLCTQLDGEFFEGRTCQEVACTETPTPHTPSQREPICECNGCDEKTTRPPSVPSHMDPVYMFSGEFYENLVDLRIRGRGTDFVWARKYGSKTAPNTAQGNGWDCSYNIFLEEDGADLILHNGWTRSDLYTDQGGGTWSRSEFFREISSNPDGTFTLTFPDSGTWHFNGFNGDPDDGRIIATIDRNGNTLTFAYDLSGRLQTITDTLGRPITLAYTPGDLIASVTDFDGRQVRYEYYDGIEPGGNLGDLKSVTTPAVTGTPNGNDFPNGKTTIYTYSTGFADERLNHNLLTITDPRGNTYLVNEYASTQDPNDFNFDRIVRQIWGDPGDVLDVAYLPQTPSPENNFAVVRTILNDREGHVKELFYDSRNRGVMYREFTGIADPDQPTTDTDNRPGPPLRAGDPTFFETRWSFNADSLITRVIHPNLNEDFFIYDETHPDIRSRGNMIERRMAPGPLGGDQTEIIELFEYDDGLGGCCGTNFVTRHVDGRGNETLHEYDAAGNRTRTTHRLPSIVEDFEYNAFGQRTAHVHPDNGSSHRRRDEMTYYGAGPQLGYLRDRIIDANGFVLTTTYEYDGRGNIVRVTDARGNATDYFVNELDQVVRMTRRPVQTSGGEVRYEVDSFYDENDNLVRRDVQNVDADGALDSNTHFTTTWEYEILNHVVRTSREREPGTMVVEEYEYDANRNKTLVRFGEATNGNDIFNAKQMEYDERDFTFRVIRAPGDAEGLQSTSQHDYDSNGNLTRLVQGLEDAGDQREMHYVWDGYDRLVLATDPMGNTALNSYDANGNVVRLLIEGELTDGPGDMANVRLSLKSVLYDAMDRAVREDVDFFDATTQMPILEGGTPDGLLTTTFVYSDNSQILSTTNDNGNTTGATYDTANRRLEMSDPGGNTLTYSYDANSNILATISTEVPDLGGLNEVFVDTYEYDGLDRRIRHVDNVGNTTFVEYDSRDNQVRVTDELSNRTLTDYDGLNRIVMHRQEVTDDGTGGGTLVDLIDRVYAWDDSSRLSAMTDDRMNTTGYQYDSLNRRIAEVMADGTSMVFDHNVHDNIVRTVDANGSETQFAYDALDRIVQKMVTPGSGVSADTTMETYEYDGVSRMVSATDDDSVVTRSYDSLFHLTSETLNGQTTRTTYDGIGNLVETTYPGGRVVTRTYDALERPSMVTDGATGMVAAYDYVGQHRVARRDLGNGTRTTYEYDGIANSPGDFGVRQIVRTTHTVIGSGAVIDDRSYAWDQVGNKIRRTDVRASGPQLDHQYSYDSLYRLRRTIVQDAAMMTVRDEQYSVDGANNRTMVLGGSDPGPYRLDPASPPSDSQLNQYSSTPGDVRTYDANGNLTGIGERCQCDWDANGILNSDDFFLFIGGFFDGDADFNADGVTNSDDFFGFLTCFFGGCTDLSDRDAEYDYRNRMVRHVADDGVATAYRYDALGRRIARIVDVDGAPVETRYFYDDWKVCEEQDELGATLATYVCGLGMDDVISMRRAGSDFFYHADDLGSVMAVTDDVGATLERYAYHDFGAPRILAPDGTPRAGSLIGNPYMFTGRRFDGETGWYYSRTRYLDPVSGRFTTRDTIGIWADAGNLGNGYAYVGHNPASMIDPTGMKMETRNCVEREKDLGKVKLKGGIGGSVGASASWKICDCCDESTQYRWIVSGYIEASGSVTISVGVGYSFAVKVFGYGIDIGIDGPDISLSRTLSIKSAACGKLPKSLTFRDSLGINVGTTKKFEVGGFGVEARVHPKGTVGYGFEVGWRWVRPFINVTAELDVSLWVSRWGLSQKVKGIDVDPWEKSWDKVFNF